MNKFDFIPVNEPLLNGNEKKYLNECIDSGWISSEGPFIKEFETSFAKRTGRKHGVAVCNGSAALETAFAALGIGPGDEVIVPSFTIISCVAPIVRAGAVPVLLDSDPVTWNMSIDEVEALITPRTRAILIVHIYGLPVDMAPLLRIAELYGLKVIEDAAEMHGQTYQGKPCGSFGDISVFSFYPNKLITTGEGGMVVTDDPILADKCRSIRNLHFQSDKRFVHDELGWNFRMTNLQAAVGLAQLERLDEFIVRKRNMGKRYTELLSDLPCIQLPLPQTPFADNIYWVFGLVIDDSIDIDAEEAMKRLYAEGIGTRPFFFPLHQQPVLKRMGLFSDASYPVAERLYRRGFYIPSGIALTNSQIEYSAAAVRKVFQ
jgi:perosamine synthetase